jgi:hypothetical protein
VHACTHQYICPARMSHSHTDTNAKTNTIETHEEIVVSFASLYASRQLNAMPILLPLLHALVAACLPTYILLQLLEVRSRDLDVEIRRGRLCSRPRKRRREHAQRNTDR